MNANIRRGFMQATLNQHNLWSPLERETQLQNFRKPFQIL